MEFLLQWLDELDDLVSAALLCWHRVRLICLVAGLAAALLVCGDRLVVGLALPDLVFVNIAAACVVTWSIMTALEVAFDRKTAAAT